MRRFLMRVFSTELWSSFLPWVEVWPLKEPRSWWIGIPPVSRTPTVAPGSLARERALLRERRARGPQKLLGPPTACVNRAVRGPCEDAEAADAWHPYSWRDEMMGDAAVPEASIVMMACRFTAERCANASVPALGFDAMTPAVPLK
jgi:hypothetical protein